MVKVGALVIKSFLMLHTFVHKERKYKEYHSGYPLIGIGTLPTPLSLARVPLPPEPREGGGLGVGGVLIPTTGEKA